MSRSEEVARAVAAVRERIARAAERAGRDPATVTLVAVTKTRPAEDLLLAFEVGIRHFGENRVQEAEAKFPSLPAGAVRHLIGPVQSNKAGRAARIADVVETVDSAAIAERLDRAAAAAGKRLPVLVEVNTGGESTKAGVAPGDVASLVEAVRALPALDLRGLMTIPPPGDTRPHFVALRELARALGLPELSMGMSDDFEAAVEEGATIVRIGTALFGAR
ncbi:YggS family pyridoxal phosphate-dependent enzyme [Acidobacteria bacterium ACD]|nr:MAG: YggS family pyridoxal phosphate-dependent enzyme [Acidobacteriota bacterium]MCE7957034.1 YggS family pyridoxal phosphate-dependent enzyme [Acidobacteria bacterium ACB2]MDL1948507.1 YggS family pyridoxal phosphate-dependent enzyme [Acidobacteria bacterium ACD]